MVVRAPLTNLPQAVAAAAAAHGAGASSVPVTGFESSKADSVRRTLYADAVSAAQRVPPPFNYLSLFNRGFDGPQGAPDVTVTANVAIRNPIAMRPRAFHVLTARARGEELWGRRRRALSPLSFFPPP